MSDVSLDLTDFDRTARLFPLPNVVLFPHAVLPLHIFEPRYRQMTADALASDQFITMALLQEGWETDYEGRPPVHDVACLGKVIASQRLPDGRYDLILAGLHRVRITSELLPIKLYRIAHVDVLLDSNAPNDARDRELRQELGQVVHDWFRDLNWDLEPVGRLIESSPNVAEVVDILSFKLPLAPAFKQQLLGEVDVQRRARLLLEHLRATRSPQAPAEQGFLPPFSAN